MAVLPVLAGPHQELAVTRVLTHTELARLQRVLSEIEGRVTSHGRRPDVMIGLRRFTLSISVSDLLQMLERNGLEVRLKGATR